ncbi:MAG: FliO/MopB family protein [Bacillota bacterium]
MTESSTPTATTTSTAASPTPTAPREGLGDMGGGTGLFTFLLASVAVIALAMYATRWLSRWQFLQGKGRRLRVVEGMAVGKDRQLLLVQVGKEVLLLGSSEGGVSLVHKVEDPELIQSCLEQPVPDQPATPSFASMESSIRAHLDRMRGLMTRNRGQSNA